MMTSPAVSDVPPANSAMKELGFYLLAGGATTPRPLLDEVAQGERLGLGTAFISERYNVKEACALAGAAVAASESIGIATGVTNHNTRHPLVTTSFATTLHYLSGGRFSLGLGRGISAMQDMTGVPRVTTAQLEDFVRVARRLWHGETVIGHDGPIGKYPVLRLDPNFDADIPLLLTAFGPHSLDLGGRCFDGVILHTFFTDQTTRKAVERVRNAAEAAGRDPSDVAVWSCFATVGDHIPEGLRLKKTVGRMASYLQGYGDLLVATNGWDPQVLANFRADSYVSHVLGAIDQIATTDELEHVATLIPDEWLAAAATGSPEQCAQAIKGQLALGCDHVILHGATPDELEPVVAAYRSVRVAEGSGSGA
jgi:probable F420-dependent oxidoreductase